LHFSSVFVLYTHLSVRLFGLHAATTVIGLTCKHEQQQAGAAASSSSSKQQQQQAQAAASSSTQEQQA
jgi:hypothetical protein